MEIEIRLGESGHVYHYEVSTVHGVMQKIKEDFKIQLEDQKIIMKSGQLAKSSMSLDSIKAQMKKTFSTNVQAGLNKSNLMSQPKQIQCLYVYNQKQLLKPIEKKVYDKETCLKTLKLKCKQMSSLDENAYDLKQVKQKMNEKNLFGIVESLSKRLKSSPFQNFEKRFTKFADNVNQLNYFKLQIQGLLDLAQNQDKARKLLIRNVEVLLDRRAKRRLMKIAQKVKSEIEKQNESVLKENSSFFSSGKNNGQNENLSQFEKSIQEIQQKMMKFYEKIKQAKISVTKQRFRKDEEVTFNVDRKSTAFQKQKQANIKQIKQLYDEFCEQACKVNVIFSKNKQKQVKDLFKSLFTLNEKIANIERKIEQHIKEYSQMFFDINKVHLKGQSEGIKQVFQMYIELIKSYENIDSEVKRLDIQYEKYQKQRIQQVKVSEFNQMKNCNMPLKKNIKSPKKEEKKLQIEQSSVSKQLQCNLPKINSPIKSKICKNNLKSFNEEITSKNFEVAIKQNKQLARRLKFNQRLQSLVKYFTNMCDKQQQLRRNFRNSKEFEDNKIDLLGVYNVPSIEIDYNETTDLQLTHLYKKWMKENTLVYDTEVNWESELIETVNLVNKTLTTYLASKSNASERQRNIEKIVSVLSQTFYKMTKSKIQKQTQRIRFQLKDQIQSQNNSLIKDLRKNNQALTEKINQLRQQLAATANSSQKSQINDEINQQNLRQLQEKCKQISLMNESLTLQNKQLQQQIVSLQQKLLNYQQEFDQNLEKIISSYESSNSEQVSKLNQQLKVEKQQVLNLSKELKDAKSQLEKAKKNLIRQVETSETLCRQIQNLEGLKQYYEKQFQQLKQMLAERQVNIIKLENQIVCLKSEPKQSNRNSNITQGETHECQCSQQLQDLRQQKIMLEQQVQSLDRQLKQILFKQTQEQQTQTQQLYDQQEKGKQNIELNQQYTEEIQKQTAKISQQKPLNNDVIEFATKPLNNFNVSSLNYDQQAVSRYYVSSMAQQWTSAFPKFSHVSIGKTIEEGMSHIFLPFSGDLYIGVTAHEQTKNFTSYQDYISEQSNLTKQPVYMLDMKKLNLRTNELLRQCSLVLVVKVQKKQQIHTGNKVMVSGKIQYALGFEDDDMTIKNYSHFLDQ